MKPWSDLRIILHQDKAMSCCPLTTVHECTYRMIAWKSAAIFRIIPLSNFHGSCHRLQDKICLQDFVMLCLYVYLYIYYTVYTYTYTENIYTRTWKIISTLKMPTVHDMFLHTDWLWSSSIRHWNLQTVTDLGWIAAKTLRYWRFPATSHLAPLHLSLSDLVDIFGSVRAAR